MAEHPTKIRLTVLRQADAAQEPYWETYEIPFREKLNVISALIEDDALIGHPVANFARWGGITAILPDADPQRLLARFERNPAAG